jgi:hypothetical protein
MSRSLDRHGQAVPWYTYPAVDFLGRKDFSSKRVLEFGGAQSTRWWAARAREVVTVEEDAAWCSLLRTDLPSNVSLHHIPLDTRTRDVSAIRALLGALGKFDVIVIDGHLRPECGALAFKHLSPRGDPR